MDKKSCTILLLAMLSMTIGISYSLMLKQKSYPSHISIGMGIPPDIDFGFYTDNNTEVTEFTYSGLMPQSQTMFNYTLKQKTSYDIYVFMRWDYSCLPIAYLNIQMYWNGTNWGYSQAVKWHTTDDVKVSFAVSVGDMNNSAWDFTMIFSVSTTTD